MRARGGFFPRPVGRHSDCGDSPCRKLRPGGGGDRDDPGRICLGQQVNGNSGIGLAGDSVENWRNFFESLQTGIDADGGDGAIFLQQGPDHASDGGRFFGEEKEYLRIGLLLRPGGNDDSVSARRELLVAVGQSGVDGCSGQKNAQTDRGGGSGRDQEIRDSEPEPFANHIVDCDGQETDEDSRKQPGDLPKEEDRAEQRRHQVSGDGSQQTASASVFLRGRKCSQREPYRKKNRKLPGKQYRQSIISGRGEEIADQRPV